MVVTTRNLVEISDLRFYLVSTAPKTATLFTRKPVDLGSTDWVLINQPVSTVEEIANIELKRSYKLDAPRGVRGRSSDNTLIKELLGWAPSISLQDGLERTYSWIYDQMKSRY